MTRRVSLVPAMLAAAVLSALPHRAEARPSHTPPPINLTYRGGPLLPHTRVATLYWGSGWSGSDLPGYFNGFFSTLFADGRYLANLAQYGVNHYPIGSGSFAGTDTDSQPPPARLRDAQIRTEIRAQVAAGHLPAPDQNTVYCVFTPPDVEVFDEYGDNSVDDFYSYHDYDFSSDGFPYIVVAYDGPPDDPHQMTLFASHELSEVVTDSEVTGSDSQVGWYDDRYGEIADIVARLYDAGRIGDADYAAELKGADGTSYWVQKFWSVRDNAPVALEKAAAASPP